jgi:hypothetical protein
MARSTPWNESAAAAAALPCAQTAPQPVAEKERILSIDALRGFALLGILYMNIQAFSMVSAAYMNPTVYGDLHGANYAVWLAGQLFADLKFMSIFSMLFGAGIFLDDRPCGSVGAASGGAALPAHGLADSLRPAPWIAAVVRGYPVRLRAMWNARVFVPQAPAANAHHRRSHTIFGRSAAPVRLRIRLCAHDAT